MFYGGASLQQRQGRHAPADIISRGRAGWTRLFNAGRAGGVDPAGRDRRHRAQRAWARPLAMLDGAGAQRHEVARFQRFAGPLAFADAGNTLQVLDLGANRCDEMRADGQLFEQGLRHFESRGCKDDAVERRYLRQA